MAPPTPADATHPVQALIGTAPALCRLREQIRHLAAFDTPGNPHAPTVLLLGETGTGKGLVARLMHQSGPRASGPFVDINCAAIPETLLEAELFGFEAGTFTDARQAKPGLFEAASGGTLFLDEIDGLPVQLQSKLLRAIEDKRVRRLGAVREQPVDIKLIAATQQDLQQCVSTGRFRADLYHRLAVIVLEIPPLRAREADVVLLAQYFLERYAQAHGLPPKRFSATATAWLQTYSWPGNVRELSHLMERATLLQAQEVLDVVALEQLSLPQGTTPRLSPQPAHPSDILPDEAARVREALLRTGGNVVRAARLLGMSRNALRHRMRKYDLTRAHLEQEELRLVGASHADSPLETHEPALLLGAPRLPGSHWEQKPIVTLAVMLTWPPQSRLHAGYEEPWTAMRHWEQLLTEKVQGFGGHWVHHSSALLTAVFGVPQAVEQMPQRALQAALAIQRLAVAPTVAPGGVLAPELRLALHMGKVLIDTQAYQTTGQLLPLDDALTYPVQLLGHAGPGDTLVSAPLGRQLASWCSLQACDLQLDMARTERVQVYRVIGPQRNALPGQRLLPQFVGRELELATLRELLAQVERGQGRAVGITGALGVGKSRLLAEFQQGLRDTPAVYVEGHCLSYGSAVPYLPMRGLLRQLCGLTDLHSVADTTHTIHAVLHDVDLEPEAWAPYLLHLLEAQADPALLTGRSPEDIQRRTFEVVQHLISRYSWRQPLVMALEDLHWIDKTSEACLAALVANLPGAPVLFLATYRPGYRPPWLEYSYVTQMSLPPLSPDASRHLVHDLLPEAADGDRFVEEILAKAEGNAFFLEELARAVVEHHGAIADLTVPATVHSALMARIDRLPAPTKRFLHTAAVLGRTVPSQVLAALWDESSDLMSHLSELKRREFLYESAGAGETVYHFTHALTQEVAYESLPVSRRHALHAIAGAAHERLYAGRLEEVTEHLAYHYARSDRVEKAVHYLVHVAETAARKYAHTEAVVALQEALTHAERLASAERPRRILELALRLAFSLSILGRFCDILTLLVSQQPHLETLDDAALAGAYHFRLGLTYTYLGEYVSAAQHAHDTIAYAQRCQDHTTLGKAYYVLSLRDFWLGQPLEGVAHGHQAITLLQDPGERHWLGLTLLVLGVNHCVLGNFAEALAAEAQLDAIADATGDPRLRCFAAGASGWVQATQGNWDTSITTCQRALAMASDPVNRAIVRGYLGLAYLESGDTAQAIVVLTQTTHELEQLRLLAPQGRYLTALGEARLMQGESSCAQELLERGLTLSQQTQYAYSIGLSQRALGRLALEQEKLPEAAQHLTEALQIFTTMQARFEIARTHLVLAELAYLQEHQPDILARLEAALQLFQTLQVAPYVERTVALAATYGLGLQAETM